MAREASVESFPPLPEAEMRGFLAAIQADPDDLASRLVFADWLEDHGDPRSELLRLAVALEPARYSGRERLAVDAHRRIKAWRNRWLPAWLPEKPAGLSVQVNRGLMTWSINMRSWRRVLRQPAVRRLLESGWVESIHAHVQTGEEWEIVRSDWPALAAWTRLGLSRSWLLGGGLTALGELPRIATLCVPTKDRCSPEELATIGRMTDLRDLQAPNAGPEALTGLRPLRRLRELVFTLEAISDEQLGAVGPHPELRDLHCCNAQHLTDAGLAVLAGMPRLRSLNLLDTGHVSRAGLEQVAKLRELRNLFMPRARGLRDEDLAVLAPLSELRCLWLWDCPWLSDAGLEHLRPLVHIEDLQVGRCPLVSAAAVRRLKRHWQESRSAQA